MTVRCPHCSTRYELPERLMGRAGAQVRCPGCRGVFAVAPDGAVGDLSGPIAPSRGTARPPDPAPAATESRAHGGPRAAARAPVAAAHESAPGPAPSPATSSDPDSVARALVNELAARAGEGPREAFARGRLFSEWGPALMDLQGEYRRRVGAAASGAPLRAALRVRWGIDLPDGDPRGPGG